MQDEINECFKRQTSHSGIERERERARERARKRIQRENGRNQHKGGRRRLFYANKVLLGPPPLLATNVYGTQGKSGGVGGGWREREREREREIERQEWIVAVCFIEIYIFSIETDDSVWWTNGGCWERYGARMVRNAR